MTLSPEGPWDLPLGGYEILQVNFAYPIDLVAYGEGGVTATIRFEGAFRLVDRIEVLDLDASSHSWEELAAVLRLRHDRIQSLRAQESGQLVLDFVSGRRIEAATTPMYENWSVCGPGFQLISLPGEGVALFGGDGPNP